MEPHLVIYSTPTLQPRPLYPWTSALPSLIHSIRTNGNCTFLHLPTSSSPPHLLPTSSPPPLKQVSSRRWLRNGDDVAAVELFALNGREMSDLDTLGLQVGRGGGEGEGVWGGGGMWRGVYIPAQTKPTKLN